MATSAIDKNSRGTLLAYNDTTSAIERVYLDPVTNAVLIFIVSTGNPTPASVPNAKIDKNDRNTMLGYDTTTGTTECLRCDTSNNLLVTPA